MSKVFGNRRTPLRSQPYLFEQSGHILVRPIDIASRAAIIGALNLTPDFATFASPGVVMLSARAIGRARELAPSRWANDEELFQDILTGSGIIDAEAAQRPLANVKVTGVQLAPDAKLKLMIEDITSVSYNGNAGPVTSQILGEIVASRQHVGDRGLDEIVNALQGAKDKENGLPDIPIDIAVMQTAGEVDAHLVRVADLLPNPRLMPMTVSLGALSLIPLAHFDHPTSGQ